LALTSALTAFINAMWEGIIRVPRKVKNRGAPIFMVS
jgi:hypothetical protein